jgi:hypothetical protein
MLSSPLFHDYSMEQLHIEIFNFFLMVFGSEYGLEKFIEFGVYPRLDHHCNVANHHENMIKKLVVQYQMIFIFC